MQLVESKAKMIKYGIVECSVIVADGGWSCRWGGREEIICLAIVVSGKAITLVSGSRPRIRIPTRSETLVDCALNLLILTSEQCLVYERRYIFHILRMINSTVEPSTSAHARMPAFRRKSNSAWGNTHNTNSRSCN